MGNKKDNNIASNSDKEDDLSRPNGGDRQAMKVTSTDAEKAREEKMQQQAAENKAKADTAAKEQKTQHASTTDKEIRTVLDDKSVKKSAEEALKKDEKKLGDAKEKANNDRSNNQ